MLLVAPVQKSRCNPLPNDQDNAAANKDIFSRLYHLRSDIPAVTHVDYSTRIQSVDQQINPKYWQLINTFKQQIG